MEPYDALREIEPDLYCIDGDWQETRFRRRMTILRTRTKELIIHNPIQLEERDYVQLETLGLVAHIVAPNTIHSSDAKYYRQRFPLAKYYPPGSIDGTWPHPLRKEVDAMTVGGLRLLKEAVFFHPISRTLVVTDLVFNMQDHVKGGEKLLYQANKIYKRFGPSRFFWYAAVRDKSELRHSLEQILKWDFDRVIMNHGDILERGGRQKLRESFAEMGIRI